MKGTIVIDQNACTGCATCIQLCPQHALALRQAKAEMVLDDCFECGHCVAACPNGAVGMKGYRMDEVMEYHRPSFALEPQVFLNSVKYRRSIRRFTRSSVSKDQLDKIIEAGRFSATSNNAQNVRYIVVERPEESIEPDAIQAFQQAGKDAGKGTFFHGAPWAILVISADTFNAALASANMETMAEALGLGVLYVGLFVDAVQLSRTLCQKLRIADGERLVMALAIGHPAVHFYRTVPRKPANVEWLSSSAESIHNIG